MKTFGLAVIILTTLFPAIPLFQLPNVSDKIALLSQYLGTAALILMAWGQLLAARFPGFENVFGGLDRCYVLHKWVGITAMGALLLHDTIDAEMRNLGRETILNEIAETLGETALYGLLILVVISVATFIPYHLWKWTHKAMGALFAAGVFHFAFIMKPFAVSDPVGLYVLGFCIAGLIAYGWTLLPETMRPSARYEVSRLEHTGGALAISLRPRGAGIRPAPGQFGVLQFSGSSETEPHPFSFSRIGPDAGLRVTVKPLGDFTHRLRNALAEGQEVRIQGPFGRFGRARNGRQIWIAAGIGITPFLTMANSLTAESEEVQLFYCASDEGAAPHLDELRSLAAEKSNLHLHTVFSSTGVRLTADQIEEHAEGRLAESNFYFCGPSAMRRELQTGLGRFGVTARNFHYEVFEFRTGIGLQKLAVWLAKKLSSVGTGKPPALDR